MGKKVPESRVISIRECLVKQFKVAKGVRVAYRIDGVRFDENRASISFSSRLLRPLGLEIGDMVKIDPDRLCMNLPSAELETAKNQYPGSLKALADDNRHFVVATVSLSGTMWSSKVTLEETFVILGVANPSNEKVYTGGGPGHTQSLHDAMKTCERPTVFWAGALYLL